MGGFFAKFYFFKMSIPSIVILSLLFSILTYYFPILWISGRKNTGVQSDFRHPSQSSIHSVYSQVWLTACGLNKGWVLLTSRWCIWNWSSEAERVTDLWPLIVAMADSPILSFVVSERRECPFKSGTAEVWRLHWHIYLHTPAADSLANEANGRHMM